MLYLSVFRLGFILYFRSRIAPGAGLADVILPIVTGLRFDSMVATYAILIPFLASVAAGFADVDRAAERIRAFFGTAFIVATAILWIVTFGYFQEYNEQFNYLIFNLYYDDTRAIFKTIWAGYHPLPVLFIIGLASGLGIRLGRRMLQRSSSLEQRFARTSYPLVARLLTGLLILLLLVVASRGSLGRRPSQRKDAAVSRDVFLNKAVVNPYFSLLFAVKDHRQQTGMAGLEAYLPDGNVRKAAQEFFHNDRAYDTLDAYFKKHAQGPKKVPPRHIFLVVMESYDAWPFLDKYASLGLTSQLSELGRKGIHVENFLPASDGTMQSLSAIITGMPYTHVEINYQTTALKPYPSSIFDTFRRLGYRTRLFYGGYLSWQRFGDFTRDQGADEIYGAPHMMTPGAATHEWGVDDEYLFEFIERTVDDDRPSFNLIMTTSYHPPYNVDVEAKGFPLQVVPEAVVPFFDNTTALPILGHLWYADRCLGDFVRNVENRLPLPLFAFTGDHFGRKFINARPDTFERAAVPFILYGQEVLNGIRLPPGAAGAHIDIGPTLIELSAPKGFAYYSVGQDLLSPRREFLGIGFSRIIGKDFIFELSNPPKFHPLPGRPLPETLPDAGKLSERLNRAYGIGWWRVRRGEKF